MIYTSAIAKYPAECKSMWGIGLLLLLSNPHNPTIKPKKKPYLNEEVELM